MAGDSGARRRWSSNRSTRASGPSSAHLGLFLDRHRVARGNHHRVWFFSNPARDQRLTRAPPFANPAAGYATDIATTSANSGAITAALKTPTADIRYAPIDHPNDPPKISPPQRASSRSAGTDAPGAQSEMRHPVRKNKLLSSLTLFRFLIVRCTDTTTATTPSTNPATRRSARSRTSSSPAGA